MGTPYRLNNHSPSTAVADNNSYEKNIQLEPNDAKALAALCGQFDQHLRQLEEQLQVQIVNRGNTFNIRGAQNSVYTCITIIEQLYQHISNGLELDAEKVHLELKEHLAEQSESSTTEPTTKNSKVSIIETRKLTIKPRGHNQQHYVRRILDNDINFGIGPAGTGKTYLAVACAVEALQKDRVSRLILVRPAVEAGENLGFLPGDLAQKIDPYLRPLYDALYEMLGFDAVTKLAEKNILEVAPLAYMRGRSLNDSFIILDEAQNTTRAQMKMFLTRIGFGSTAVVTGDTSQIDLPKGSQSGLIHAARVLENVKGITFTQFKNTDVVRHPLVQKIVSAYDNFNEKNIESNF